jgi:hypothetical protein
MSAHVRLDRLLGTRVLAANNRSIGRLEEFRAEKHGTGVVVTDYVTGPAGLWERLGLGARRLFGTYPGRGYLIRWDQLDLSDSTHPRLLCSVEALRKA